MFGPNPFGETDTWRYKIVTSRFDVGFQEFVEAVDAHVTPCDEENVVVQIVKDFGMLVGNVAPHHHAFAVGAQYPIDAVNVLVINLFRSNGVHVCFGVALPKALRFVAVDVEIR